jgi:prephenate dehydrogenase
MHWQKVTLVGVGLLGGSLGLAMKQRNLAGRVEGYVRRESSIAECEKFGVVDKASCDLQACVKDADLIVLCTPLAQMRGLVEKMLPVLRAGSLLTAVGSVKASEGHDL